jgi:hypothetical protein
VDFKTFTFETSQGTSGPIKLNKGMYLEWVDPKIPTKCKLTRIRYVDFDADGREDALVSITVVVPGSACYFEDHYVFVYRKGFAHQVFHSSKEQGYGVRVAGRRLVIVAPHWSDADAHCCPSFKEWVTYRWRGGQFVVVGRHLRRDPSRRL